MVHYGRRKSWLKNRKCRCDGVKEFKNSPIRTSAPIVPGCSTSTADMFRKMILTTIPGLTFEPAGHIYRWCGKVVPSVTQLTKQLATFVGNNEAAMELGIKVHLTAHLDDIGDLDEASLGEPLAGYLKAWRAWKTKNRAEILGSEVPLYNEMHGYAGTPDKYAVLHFLNSRRMTRAVVDIKTGEWYPSYGPQLAGYRALIEPRLGVRIRERLGVALQPDGTYEEREYTDPNDMAAFLGCLAQYRFKEKA